MRVDADADARRVYIGNVGFTTTEPDLIAHFGAHGFAARDVTILRGDTGRPRGVAFATLPSIAEAERAITELDTKPLAGRELRVAWPRRLTGRDAPRPAHASPRRAVDPGAVRLFAGNLPYLASEEDLGAHVAALIGGAPRVCIPRDAAGRGGRGFAFIDVPAAEVERVRVQLEGVPFQGRSLRIKLADDAG